MSEDYTPNTTTDDELKAMKSIVEIIAPMDDGTRLRVLNWVLLRLRISPDDLQ